MTTHHAHTSSITSEQQTMHEPDAPLAVECPHCKKPLHIVLRHHVALANAPAVPLSDTTAQVVSRSMVRRRWHALTAFAQRLVRRDPGETLLGRLIVVALLIGAALLCFRVIGWVQHQVAPPPQSPTATPSTTAQSQDAVVSAMAADAAQQAIIATLTGYHAAETEAAARLSIAPLVPYIDPTSSFAAARAEQLAARRARQAPHQSTLVQWTIGAIQVDGATATVVTQETWQNREAEAVAAQQATVQMTYTLRRDSATGSWRIVASVQRLL